MDPVFFDVSKDTTVHAWPADDLSVLVGWTGKTTHWTQAFVAFCLMNSLNVIVHPFLAFVGFKTIFIWAAFLHNR